MKLLETQCAYCANSTTDELLDFGFDGSSFSVGDCEKGYSMYITSETPSNFPVSLEVLHWDDTLHRNVTVARFVPKYCPFCGREIVENKNFLKQKLRKGNKNA